MMGHVHDTHGMHPHNLTTPRPLLAVGPGQTAERLDHARGVVRDYVVRLGLSDEEAAAEYAVLRDMLGLR